MLIKELSIWYLTFFSFIPLISHLGKGDFATLLFEVERSCLLVLPELQFSDQS